MTLVRVDRIVVGERRRQDAGDVAGLAASIRQHGLLHPIVVDDRLNLIAGGRRLEAVQQLGWDEVEVRQLGTLSGSERRVLELEENLRRKDLTDLERSRHLTDLAATAAAVLTGPEFLPTVGRNSPKEGRPASPTAQSKVADYIGVPRTTVQRAQQHVAAVERYPELAPLNGSAEQTVKMAKALDALSDDDRPLVREKVKAVDSDTLNDLLGQPRFDDTGYRRFRVQLDRRERWAKALNALHLAALEVHEGGGIAEMVAAIPPSARREYGLTIEKTRGLLGAWLNALNEGDGNAD